MDVTTTWSIITGGFTIALVSITIPITILSFFLCYYAQKQTEYTRRLLNLDFWKIRHNSSYTEVKESDDEEEEINEP